MTEGRRSRRREEMRARLLASALTLFAEQGFSATTIDEIAEHADVARQTVLNYYPTKTDFVRAWGRRRRAEAESLLTDVPTGEQQSPETRPDETRPVENRPVEHGPIESGPIERGSGGDPLPEVPDATGVRASLHRLYRALGRINERERTLTRVIYRDQYQVLAPERPVPNALLALLEQAQHTGDVRLGLDIRVLAEILTGIYFDTLARWLVPEAPPFDLPDEIVTRIDVVFDGAAAHDHRP